MACMPKGLWDVHYARLWQCGNPILTCSVAGCRFQSPLSFQVFSSVTMFIERFYLKYLRKVTLHWTCAFEWYISALLPPNERPPSRLVVTLNSAMFSGCAIRHRKLGSSKKRIFFHGKSIYRWGCVRLVNPKLYRTFFRDSNPVLRDES